MAKQTQASDQWAYYQAKSTREYLAHVTAAQSPDPALRKQLLADEQRYAKEKNDIQKKAGQLEEESARLDAKAEAVLKPHRRMALAMTLIQIAIALCSITVLTRRRWLFVAALTAALAGLATAVFRSPRGQTRAALLYDVHLALRSPW